MISKCIFRSNIKNLSLIAKFSTSNIEIKKNASPVEVGRKQLKENQVRLQVKYYCANSKIDIDDDESKTLSLRTGFEISGEVIEIGSNVQADVAVVGEKVAALNFHKLRNFSSECIVDKNDVFRLPANVNESTATTILFGHSTALYAFSKLCKPTPKEHTSLFISCGAAGLGLAALDVAAGIFKSRVIGITDTEEHAELMRQRGAFAALTFNEKKIHQKVLKFNENKEIDIVYDSLNKDSLMMKSVKLGGIVISITNDDDKIFKPLPNILCTRMNLEDLRRKNVEAYRQIVIDTLELADQGVLSPHISGKFNVDKLNEAIKYIGDQKAFGKVLIRVDL